MEKYGFVYIWYDRKRKMYYIGCHWGTVDDGYICSSNRMRDAYRRRPQDFKRKILSKVYTNKKDLLEEEHQWFSLIKEEELGQKYYNLRKHKWGHWSTDENSKLTVGEKISLAHKKHPNWGHWSIGKTRSEETKQKLREANKKQFEDLDQIEMRRQKSAELWLDPEYRKIQSEKKIGKKQSSEQIRKRVESCKERWKLNPKTRCLQSEETKKKISDSFKNMIWITDGKNNKRINKFESIPIGFSRGRTKNKFSSTK